MPDAERTREADPTHAIDDPLVDLSEPHGPVPWAILYLDRVGLIQRAAGMVEVLLGQPAEALVGRPPLTFAHPDDRETLRDLWPDVLAVPERVRTVPIRLVRPDASTVWTESLVINQLHGDGGSILWVLHDVSEHRAREEEARQRTAEAARWAEESHRLAEESDRLARLRDLAERDQLTGALSRRALDQVLGSALEERAAGLLVAFVDLHGLEAVDDEHGEEAGDTVLRTVAWRVHGAVRPADRVAHYSDGQFVVVCRNVAPSAEGPIAARIRAALARPVRFSGGQWASGASVGLTRHQYGDDVVSLLRRAEQSKDAEPPVSLFRAVAKPDIDAASLDRIRAGLSPQAPRPG